MPCSVGISGEIYFIGVEYSVYNYVLQMFHYLTKVTWFINLMMLQKLNPTKSFCKVSKSRIAFKEKHGSTGKYSRTE